MNIILKMILFIAMTVSVIVIIGLAVAPITRVDRGISTFVSTILFIAYLISFIVINDKKQWMKI